VRVDFGVPAAAYNLVDGLTDGVVAVGAAGPDVALAAFDGSMSPVRTFGHEGRVTTSFGGRAEGRAAFGDKESILVFGTAQVGAGSSVAVARYDRRSAPSTPHSERSGRRRSTSHRAGTRCWREHARRTACSSPARPAVPPSSPASTSTGSGQLGHPNLSTAVVGPYPGYVEGLTGTVVAIAGGGLHTLAVLGDGAAWAWGSNGVGQLGDGTTIDRALPTKVAGIGPVTAVAAGMAHTVALLRDGTVATWGWNVLGLLGDATTADRHAPVVIPGIVEGRSIAAGVLHTVAS
jgi:hypothetical protein